MYDPDNPELQDKDRNAAQYFEKAYWQVMAQVEAPKATVAALLPVLYDAYKSGKAVSATFRDVEQWLPEGTWRWPEYERQLPDMRKREYEEIKKYIETINNLKSLASMISLNAFKKIALDLLGNKMPPIRKWEQAHKLCETIGSQDYKPKALELLRNVVLEKQEKKINESDDMLQMLVIRIHRLANGFFRYQQIAEAEIFSYLKLSVFEFDLSKARPQCIAIKDKALHINNPYWKNNLPPCERLDCRCHITAKTEHGVQRAGLEIIDKI